MSKLEILKNCVNKTSLQLIKPLFEAHNQVFYKLRLEQNHQFCQFVADQFIPKDFPILKFDHDFFINIESWEQMLDNQPRSHILDKIEIMIKKLIPIDNDENFKKSMLLVQLTMQTYDKIFSSKPSELWKNIYDTYQHPFLNEQLPVSGFVEQYENEEYNTFYQYFKILAEQHEKNFSVDKDKFFKCLLITRSMMFQPQFEQQFDLVNPFLSLIQHNFEENSYWQKYYDFSIDKDFIMLIAKKDIQKEEKITFNYADKNNINLLSQYGITLPDNPYDKISLFIQLEKFPEILDCYDFKFRILQNKDDKFDIENILIDVYQEQVKKLLLCSQQDFLDYKIYQKTLQFFNEPFSEKIEQNLKTLLKIGFIEKENYYQYYENDIKQKSEPNEILYKEHQINCLLSKQNLLNKAKKFLINQQFNVIHSQTFKIVFQQEKIIQQKVNIKFNYIKLLVMKKIFQQHQNQQIYQNQQKMKLNVNNLQSIYEKNFKKIIQNGENYQRHQH